MTNKNIFVTIFPRCWTGLADDSLSIPGMWPAVNKL